MSMIKIAHPPDDLTPVKPYLDKDKPATIGIDNMGDWHIFPFRQKFQKNM